MESELPHDKPPWLKYCGNCSPSLTRSQAFVLVGSVLICFLVLGSKENPMLGCAIRADRFKMEGLEPTQRLPVQVIDRIFDFHVKRSSNISRFAAVDMKTRNSCLGSVGEMPSKIGVGEGVAVKVDVGTFKVKAACYVEISQRDVSAIGNVP